MQITPYLFLEGRCEEALGFYEATLGAKITAMMRFSEAPDLHMPVPADKIMHAAFTVGTTDVMASDGMCTGKPNLTGFGLSLATIDVSEAEAKFALLADGGQIRQPLSKTFFSPAFGTVADKFGVTWLVMACEPAQANTP